MKLKEIKSADNPTIKRISKLKNKKFRDESGTFMAEGILSLESGLSSSYELDEIVISQSFMTRNAEFCQRFGLLTLTTDKLFETISDAETPQGIMGIFKIPQSKFTIPLRGKNSAFIYCDNIRDPGNVGTIIRTADALGMSGVLLSAGCADIYSPKLVRSTMGSVFHTKICDGCGVQQLLSLKDAGFVLVSSALYEKSISLYKYNIPDRVVFIIGNESHGVSEKILTISDETVKIPMHGFAESLNAAVAAAIIMSEAARVRGNINGK